MTTGRCVAVAALCALVSLGAAACDGLSVTQAWIREPPPGTATVALYMQIENTSQDTVVIDAVSSPAFAHAMLHETVRDGDRVQMRHVAALTLAPGQRVALAPGGLHAMLMNPKQGSPHAGDTIEVTLTCGSHQRQLEVPVQRDAP